MIYFLRNYRMNAKLHHFSIRLHVLHRTMQAQLPSFTFMALNSEGFDLMHHIRKIYASMKLFFFNTNILGL